MKNETLLESFHRFWYFSDGKMEYKSCETKKSTEVVYKVAQVEGDLRLVIWDWLFEIDAKRETTKSSSTVSNVKLL